MSRYTTSWIDRASLEATADKVIATMYYADYADVERLRDAMSAVLLHVDKSNVCDDDKTTLKQFYVTIIEAADQMLLPYWASQTNTTTNTTTNKEKS